MDVDIENFNNFVNSWWPYVITLVISIISGIRIYAAGPSCTSPQRMDEKVVLITGASSGIGFQTAKELAARGARIILTCRDALKGRKALELIRYENPEAQLDLRILDVSLISNIRDFVEDLKKDYEKIHVLINNAGIIFHPFKKTLEDVELTLATNYLGPFFLTHLLIPLLEKSESGRVINVTALAHYNGKINLDDLNLERNFEPREAFAQSKLALTVLTKHMGKLYYKKTKITFNSANPGVVRNTGHFNNSSFTCSTMTKISVWPWVWLFLKTPKQGCQTIVYLAVEPSLNTVSGCYFSDCERKEPAESVNDNELAEKLYVKSVEMCSQLDKDFKIVNSKVNNINKTEK